MLIRKCDVEEICRECGLLIGTRKSGVRCFKRTVPRVKLGTHYRPDPSLLGTPNYNIPEPETCEDFTPKAVTRFVLRMEESKTPLTVDRPTPDGYKTEITGWLHSDAVLVVEPHGHSWRISDYKWFLQHNKHIPIEIEQPVEMEIEH